MFISLPKQYLQANYILKKNSVSSIYERVYYQLLLPVHETSLRALRINLHSGNSIIPELVLNECMKLVWLLEVFFFFFFPFSEANWRS